MNIFTNFPNQKCKFFILTTLNYFTNHLYKKTKNKTFRTLILLKAVETVCANVFGPENGCPPAPPLGSPY